MNIFVLSLDPVKAAQEQCDKHVPKMVVESGQMLSTAHRILDGVLTRRRSMSGKTMAKYWELFSNPLEDVLYRQGRYYINRFKKTKEQELHYAAQDWENLRKGQPLA